MKYLCKLQYDGTNFCGFQVQPNGRTVQEVLNVAANTTFGKPVRVTGCSRTDSGVHAKGFCVTLELDGGILPIPPEKLPLAILPNLPDDLSLYEAVAVPDDFHPRYSVIRKEYEYLIYNERVPSPFFKNRAWQLSRPIDDCALVRMQSAANFILGRRDFASFMAEGSDIKDTVRTVDLCRVVRDGSVISVTVGADGFLYRMVRNIVGTLVDVAFGRIEPDEIEGILNAKKRAEAGQTAPPEGLYLKSVYY